VAKDYSDDGPSADYGDVNADQPIVWR
jgi:hypothetical protein